MTRRNQKFLTHRGLQAPRRKKVAGKDASGLYSGFFPLFGPGLFVGQGGLISPYRLERQRGRRLSLVRNVMSAWSWREWLRCSKQPMSGRLPFPTERPRDGGVAEAPPREQQVGGEGLVHLSTGRVRLLVNAPYPVRLISIRDVSRVEIGFFFV